MIQTIIITINAIGGEGKRMTIYLDIVFIENILMNYIILMTTGIICKKKIKKTRLIISSIIGSLYSVAYYITQFEIYRAIVVKVTLSIIMIYIAFSSKNLKKIFKEIMLFYLTSFVFGGCAFSILYYIKPENILYKQGNLIGTYPIKIAILGGIIGFFIINMAFKLVKNKINIEDMYCDIKISNNGKKEKIRAMIDTGNLLKDPITNSPVVIIEKNSLSNLLPKNILESTKQIMNGKYEFEEDELEYISKFRVLPFSSLGKQNGMLLGFKVDKIETEVNEEEIIRDDVIIGIYDKKLSSKKEYEGLIGLNCIEKG